MSPVCALLWLRSRPPRMSSTEARPVEKPKAIHLPSGLQQTSRTVPEKSHTKKMYCQKSHKLSAKENLKPLCLSGASALRSPSVGRILQSRNPPQNVLIWVVTQSREKLTRVLDIPGTLLVVTFHSVTKLCWRTSRNLHKLKRNNQGSKNVSLIVRRSRGLRIRQ